MFISRRFKFFFKIYALILKIFLKKSGSNNLVSPLAQIVGKKNIEIGKNIRIGSYSRLEFPEGSLCIGNNNQIYRFSQIISYKGKIKIGSFNSIHPYVSITGPGNVSIGSNVRIAVGVSIIAGSHVFEDASKPIHHQGMKSKGIIIEDDVWIGAKATILDGVTIAKGTVVGTNAVVTKSTKPYEIYVGVPAKSIGKRS
jgi:acetyltransferase-like isoleucine patch superfamily enzyme